MAYANKNTLSTTTTGIIGLNTVPTARMDASGTVRVGVSTSDPYNHAFMGMQIAKPLYVNLRQTMLVSSIGDEPTRVYPGMDLKLRIREESRYSPEISFGMDSALGHKRHSSEYFALSKRINDFDLTAGIAWGRLGSAGHIANPFARISNHFDHDRDYTDEDAASPSDWFTGKQIGFFGGVEYFTPIKGLSFKADIGADSYPGERASFDFSRPAPWSIGFNYSPKEWVAFGASLVGGDKVMARLTLQDNLFDWSGKSYKDSTKKEYIKNMASISTPAVAKMDARSAGIDMGKVRVNGSDISGVLHLNDTHPSAMQIGRATRYLTANAGKEIQSITIIPVRNNIQGKAIVFSRRDLEQAMVHKKGSPEEIWQDINFKDDRRSIKEISTDTKYKIFPELALSLGEEDTSHLYRVSVVGESTKHLRHGFYTGTSVRLNIADRLYQLDKIRAPSDNRVRSDVSNFARGIVNLDRSFLSWMKTVKPDLHLAVSIGYLEEMYSGTGGEVLYRPFQSPFAIGAEIWRVNKRLPETFMALGTEHEGSYTGHLNLFYEVPDTDITAFARVGKYLGGDIGATGGLQTEFRNGMKIKGFVTATNDKDIDAFGKDMNVYSGIEVSLPFGHMKYAPEGSEARIKIAPMGRNAGQALDKPVSLYETTEPMSYRHLGRSWQEVLE